VLAAVALAAAGIRGLVAPATNPLERRQEASAPPSPPAAPTAPDRPADPISPEPGVEQFRLANGLNVLLRPIKGSQGDRAETRFLPPVGLNVSFRSINGSPVTAMVVLYAIGNDHDPEGRSGLGHAIEHLYVTAAAGAEPARTSAEFLRRYPAGANAQTGDRYTVISCTFPTRDLDRELAAAAARMKDLRVTAADLERERPRLLQEVANMFERSAGLAAVNNARELVRGAGIGRRSGLPEDLRAISLEEVQARLDRYYKPRNASLSLAGDFDPATARRMIETHFAAIPAGQEILPAREPAGPKFLAIQAVKANSGEPTACLAYLAPRPGSALYAPFLVLVSRLSVASDLTGLSLYFTPIDDGTVVAISAPLRKGESPAEAFERIKRFVADAVRPRLGAFEKVLTKQRFGMILSTAGTPDAILGENLYGVAFSIARRDQLEFDPVQFDRALAAVTDDDLRRAASEIFDPMRQAGAMVSVGGPRP
jgi:zinc protease